MQSLDGCIYRDYVGWLVCTGQPSSVIRSAMEERDQVPYTITERTRPDGFTCTRFTKDATVTGQFGYALRHNLVPFLSNATHAFAALLGIVPSR
ncbi:MAG: hypothetical protein HY696_08645 [Deltaproteobacteria bacterium]|nr:hypothetical protein [Deltaproteobacteria bacterium]